MTFSMFMVDYNVWRFLHKSAFFIVLLGFTHSIFAGSDLDSVTSIICWICLLALAAAVFIWRNAFVPLRGRDKFEVTEIRPETYNTYTVTLKSPSGKRLPHNPGQFMFLKLKRPGRLSETHPFTISSLPLPDNIVQATIKKSGNFTNTIDQTVAGDIGIIEGPYGRFSFVNYDVKSFLFIAGGVGMTPIMSMLRYLKETDDIRPAVLLYGNRTEKDIIFREELDHITSNVKVVHILSNPDDSWRGPRGHISTEIIQQYAADILHQADIFLCGPPIMMMSINRILKRLDIPASKIHFELFTI
jgi:predicted ferric reductase